MARGRLAREKRERGGAGWLLPQSRELGRGGKERGGGGEFGPSGQKEGGGVLFFFYFPFFISKPIFKNNLKINFKISLILLNLKLNPHITLK